MRLDYQILLKSTFLTLLDGSATAWESTLSVINQNLLPRHRWGWTENKDWY